MKRKFSILMSVIAILSLIFINASWAQQGKGAGRGWGTGNGRIYNPQTVETLTGEVVSVESIPGKGGGQASGVHLTLKTDKETIPVHLGPSWYLDRQNFKIGPRDKIEVTGSRVVFGSKPAIIAAEVKKGDQVLKLRNQAGIPQWAGQRWR